MNVFEKILERLEEKKSLVPVNRLLDDIIKDKPKELGQLMAYADAIKIVQEVAEEFATDTNVGTNGWIPCSERLPERNKPVLCWVKSTTIESGETYIIGSCDNGFWFLQTYEIGHHHFPVKDYKVVAWQTLPEHYEEK